MIHTNTPNENNLTKAPSSTHVLVLWNHVGDDIYEQFSDSEPRPLPWDENRTVSEVGTLAEEMEAFLRALRGQGYRVDCVNVQDDVDRLIASLRLHQPDVIFNLVEYFYDDESRDIHVAGLYELFDIPYTGSEPVTLATCMRKERTKMVLEYAGLLTPAFFVASPDKIDDPETLDMEYPLIVKPPREDASGGISRESVVMNKEALEARVRFVHDEYEQAALVEEYIEGREIHVAILGNGTPRVLPLFEMEFDDSEFNPEDEWRPQIISYDAKWDPHTQDFYAMDAVCPAPNLAPEVEENIRKLALSAYRELGCRDYARVDMRLDEEHTPYILEVNPNPDLTDDSAFVMCAKASGMSYGETLDAIVRACLERHQLHTPQSEEYATSDTLYLRYKAGGSSGDAAIEEHAPSPEPSENIEQKAG